MIHLLAVVHEAAGLVVPGMFVPQAEAVVARLMTQPVRGRGGPAKSRVDLQPSISSQDEKLSVIFDHLEGLGELALRMVQERVNHQLSQGGQPSSSGTAAPPSGATILRAPAGPSASACARSRSSPPWSQAKISHRPSEIQKRHRASKGPDPLS